ncbi:MAG: U32 family peptidase [Lachnospiraceae bacterium]|nr:U32 family peptidase [Lachnospiraceae bacterium]
MNSHSKDNGKKNVELLAPAGDYACFLAAVNAGADAVYLGGTLFGARAYASNFSNEELLEAISYAHVFGVKVYLTVNTLVKERERKDLLPFLIPFYEAGLDGVIVQDFGVLKMCREHFPDMECHASTQMCIASAYGARLLKAYGVSRVVPARELSLEELKDIKNEGVEVEAFVHGAMCYAYSGQCLFSSFLGGRSGNRGRCAGSCRLPYSFGDRKEEYPLSLKDMCTVTILDKLIDAGIDSFKIEGRMKNPYYVAGVTALYRKYIDLYERDPNHFRVTDEDLALLHKLYIRSELSEGYYERHNGKEMVSLHNPAYKSADEAEFAEIKERFLDKNRQLGLSAEVYAKVGEALSLTVWDGIRSVTVQGDIVQQAEKRTATKEDIEKQIAKTGNTPFHFDEISVIIEGSAFLPVKQLNDIRRNALEEMKHLLCSEGCRTYREPERTKEETGKAEQAKHAANGGIVCYVSNEAQAEDIADFVAKVPGTEMTVQISHLLLEQTDVAKLCAKLHACGIRTEFALPRVFRKRAATYLDHALTEEILSGFDGILVNTLDGLAYAASRIEATDRKAELLGSAGLYVTNTEALRFVKELGVTRYTSSLELNEHQQTDILPLLSRDIFVYGHIPFMQTAGCLKKTYDLCDHKSGWQVLTDRRGQKLPVYNDCILCENTIFNGVVLSLHREFAGLTDGNRKFYFTNESHPKAVLTAFLNGEDVPYADYTKGHFKKGME